MGTALLSPPEPLGAGKTGGGALELSFSLDDPAFQGDHFRMYDFKVKRCPRARPHDWTACPFAHPGEKAKRRDPRRYRYSGTACPDFRKTGVCRRGDACPYSHGVFECWLHPSRYRTQMCTDGPSCRRRVCFFAHYEHELRRAEEYPPLLTQQLHAGLVAEARALQQQQLAQALSGILGSSAAAAVPALPGGTTSLEPLMSVQLLKTLQQQTPTLAVLAAGGGSACGDASSAPATPTGIAGLSPNSAAAGLAPPTLQDNSKLLLQLQLMQQGQALGALHSQMSDASQQSGSSPGGSPRIMAAAEAVARQGSPPLGVAAVPQAHDETSHLARLIQQQQQQAVAAAAAAAAAAAGSIDPALLAALQNLGLGAVPGAGSGMQGVMQEALDATGLGMGLGLSRRSIDNGALSRQFAPSSAPTDNYLAAAAAALASGTAVGGLGGGGGAVAGAGAPAAAGTPATMLNTAMGGSLPSQSFMASAAAALQVGTLGRGGTPPGIPGMGAARQTASPTLAMEDDRALSLDHILAELPRSASQVNLQAP